MLERWYSGETTPSEEVRIASLLSKLKDSHSLSEDLQADAALFKAMGETEGQEVAMPTEAEAKLEKALTTEMRRKPFPRIFRYASAAAAAVVVLLAIGITLYNAKPVETQYAESRPIMESKTDNPGIQPMDTATNIRVIPEKVKPLTARNQKHDTGAAERKVRSMEPEITGYNSNPDEEEYEIPLSDEEKLLAEGNIRVVDDAREAYSIVSAVFSRLDDNFEQQQGVISSLNDDYREITKSL